MAVFKVTLLFQQLSKAADPNYPVHRVGGWSESWYITAASLSSAIVTIKLPSTQNLQGGGGTFGATDFLGARAALLASGASIVGVRLQQVNPPGPSQTLPINIAGAPGTMNDVPQMALLVRAPGIGVQNVRRFTLRGIPDQNVVEGEFVVGTNYSVLLTNFFQSILGFQFRARDLSQPAFKILNVSPAGLTSTEANVSAIVGSICRVLKSKDSGGRLRGGRFSTNAGLGGTNSITINNWPWGATTGGSIRLDGIVYPTVDVANISVSRIITRRVGRPFTGYRGRRSARH